MPLIEQRVPTLIGGVSQQPPALRDASQLEEQINGLSHPILGLLKRPHTDYVAKLTSTTDGLAAAFDHAIDLSDTERYRVIILDGSVRVYDALTGISLPVTTPNGVAYLNLQPTAAVQLNADSFTGTNGTDLASHTSDVGASWTMVSGAVGDVQIQNNVAEQQYPGSATVVYRLNYAVAQNDYTVSANMRTKSSSSAGNQETWIKLRGNTSDQSGYAARVVLTATPTLNIYRVDAAGATTSLAGAFNLTGISPIAGYFNVALRATGNFLEALVNGVVIGSATDSTYPTGRYTGIVFKTPSSIDRRTLLDNFTISYQPPASSAGAPQYRAVTVGETTYIVNQSQVAIRGTAASSAATRAALVVVRQGDFGTAYSLTLNGIQVSLGTAQGVTPQTRPEIATDVICDRLKALLTANVALTGFTYTRYGSTLYIYRSDNEDFTLTATDGLADNGLLVIKGSVQRFSDLPVKAPDGFIVEVTGDPDNKFDNYFVQFDDTDLPGQSGVWRECVKPGELISLSESTMPHRLIRNGSYIDDQESAGAPPQPLKVPGGGTAITSGFYTTGTWTGGAIPRRQLHNHAERGYVKLTDANGIATEISVYFDLDSRNTKPNNPATVSICSVATPSDPTSAITRLVSAQYGADLVLRNQKLTAPARAWAADEHLVVILEYDSGSTPADGERTDVYLHSNSANEEEPGVQYIKRTGQSVVFEATRKYPAGAVVAVTVGATACSHTVPAGDQTGVQVATALELLTEAVTGYSSVLDPDYSAAVLITKDDGTAPTVSTPTITFSEATKFHNPDLTQTTDALVGKTIKNLTDNSSGVVTANTATTITVASLSGGVRNTFDKGDLCQVVEASGPYFIFTTGNWKRRVAGDLTTNPYPSFIDRRISDVFFHRGRLGFLSGSNVVLSEAGEPRNFFRTSTAGLLDADVIDVSSAANKAVHFHAATEWDDKLILWSDRQQFALGGDPILTPASVSLTLISNYPNSPSVRPVVTGRRVYFVHARSGYTQVYEYRVMENHSSPEAIDLTLLVPRYIAGAPLRLDADEDTGLIFVHTDNDRTRLHVAQTAEGADLPAWSKWDFATTSVIVGYNVNKGVLDIIQKLGDGTYLVTMDLSVALDSTDLLIDRQFASSLSGVSPTYSGGNTTWTLPYAVATDGSEGTVQVVAADGTIRSTTRPSTTTVRATGDYTGSTHYLGIRYTFTATLSTLYMRDKDGRPETRGRTQLRSITAQYGNTRAFTVTVTPTGRTARTTTVSLTSAASSQLRVPVLGENDCTTIAISNNTPLPCYITGLDLEMFYAARGQRV